jgi:hypothetical protein
MQIDRPGFIKIAFCLLLALATTATVHAGCDGDVVLGFEQTDAAANSAMEIAGKSPMSALQSAALVAKAKIDAQYPEKVPYEWVSKLWSGILARTHGWGPNLDIDLNDEGFQDARLTRRRMGEILEDLGRRGNIRVLTPELKAKLEKQYCQPPKPCSKIHGFYLPLTHHLFIDPTVPPEGAAAMLEHELRHAYQFTYRFPIDLALLSKFSEEGKIKLNDLDDYLNYFYESQATWKGGQVWLSPKWYPYVDMTRPPLNVWKDLKSTFAATADGRFKINRDFQAEQVNPYLPIVSRFGTQRRITGLYPAGANALTRPELVISSSAEKETAQNYRYLIDFKFLHRFATRIAETYRLKKLVENNQDNREIYNSLHNNSYRRLIAGNELDLNPSCQNVIKKIQDKSSSPMVEWLSMSQTELESCPSYSHPGGEKVRADYEKRFLERHAPDSPFSTLLRDGGGGTHPGLDIIPGMVVLPQMEVTPSDEVINDEK